MAKSRQSEHSGTTLVPVLRQPSTSCPYVWSWMLKSSFRTALVLLVKFALYGMDCNLSTSLHIISQLLRCQEFTYLLPHLASSHLVNKAMQGTTYRNWSNSTIFLLYGCQVGNKKYRSDWGWHLALQYKLGERCKCREESLMPCLQRITPYPSGIEV